MMPNGLWVVHQEKPTSLKAITLHTKGGAGVEKPGETGLAHFIEHVLFKSSKKYPSESTTSALIEQEGGKTNAFTSKDKICSYIQSRLQTRLMFDILSDEILRPAFRVEDIAVELGPVQQEIAQSMDDPGDNHAKIYDKLIWGEHPYGDNILGTKEQVASFKREDFVRYHEKYFVPANMVLSVAGGISASEVFELAHEFFGEGAKIIGAKVVFPEVDFNRVPEKTSFLQKDTEQVRCGFGTLPAKNLGGSGHEKSLAAASMMASILGGGMSAPLFKVVRSENGLVYFISAGISSFENAGSFWIDFGTDAKNLIPAIKLALSETDRILKNGVAKEDLQKVINMTATNYAVSLESSLGVAIAGGNNAIYGRDTDSIESYFRLLDSLTVDDIMEAARALLPKENFHIALYGNVESQVKDLEAIFNS